MLQDNPKSRRVRLITGACLVAGITSAAAKAQDVAPSGTAAAKENQTSAADIVVTARRQTERVQDVPASISVVTAAQLTNSGVKTLEDVSQLVPNLNFNRTFRAGVPDVAIRGMATPQGGEPPVAIIVDGVEVPSLEFFDQNLLDIRDIEVLRGPQGALYGRGAVAGAIVINTAVPTRTLHNDAMLDFSSGDDVRAVDTVSGPVVGDVLLGKLTVEDHNRAGQIRDTGTGKPADWVHEGSLHGELLGNLSPSTRVELRGSYLRGAEGAAYQSVFANSAINTYPKPNRQLNTRDRRRQWNVSLKIEQDTPIGTLTSVSQYAKSESDLYGSSPAPNRIQMNNIGVNAFNQDLRLSSIAGNPVQWFVGAFYQHRTTDNFLHVFGTGPNSGVLYALRDDYQKSDASAVYGQVIMPLPAGFNLTGALRYDTDKRSDVDRLVPSGSYASQRFESLQPAITLKKKFTPSVMAYVTAGRGFGSGGFNAYQDAISIGVPRIYGAELATNYEAGIKSTFFDHRLTINADVFHTIFNNDQVFLVSSFPPSRDILTVRRVHLDGGEIEATLRATSELSFDANIGLNHSKIKNYNGTSLYVGNYTPNAYGSTVNLGAQYEHSMSNDLSWLARVDYSRLGRIYWNLSNSLSSDPSNWVNARIALRNSHWEFAIYGRNLTRQKAWSFVNADSLGIGTSTGYLSEPRTFGLEIISRY